MGTPCFWWQLCSFKCRVGKLIADLRSAGYLTPNYSRKIEENCINCKGIKLAALKFMILLHSQFVRSHKYDNFVVMLYVLSEMFFFWLVGCLKSCRIQLWKCCTNQKKSLLIWILSLVRLRFTTVLKNFFDEILSVSWTMRKPERHSAKRMYLRQSCSDGSRWLKPL